MLVSFTRVLLVAALAVSSLAAPDIHSPTRTSRNAAAPINPVGVVARSLARNPAVYLTNAQRLSRGLPPNRPRAHARRALKARQSSTCVAQTGTIRAVLTDPVSGTTVDTGYVSMDANDFGEYGFTTDRADAISVSLCPESGNTFDILTLVCSSHTVSFLAGVAVSQDAADSRVVLDRTASPPTLTSEAFAVSQARTITLAITPTTSTLRARHRVRTSPSSTVSIHVSPSMAQAPLLLPPLSPHSRARSCCPWSERVLRG